MSASTPSLSQAGDSASPHAKTPSQPPQHTRTYQACIPCRRRKVRCDLGPVDNPHEPPCVRCRRESKECFFSATRRKRKPQDGGDGFDDDGPSDYEVRNGRKRLRDDSETPRPAAALPHFTPQTAASFSPVDLERPLTPGGSVGRHQPLRRPHPALHAAQDEQQQVNNETTAILQSKEVFSGHDALNLLFEAAGRTGDMDHHRAGSVGHHQRTGSAAHNNVNQHLTSPGVAGGLPWPGPGASRTGTEPVVDPAISQGQANGEINDHDGYEDALKAWSRFRFVRAGWFTAKEGIAYLDYFYRYLSPLTPIVVPNFERYETHLTLLTEEPMLVVTLLTVSSRYMGLTGPGSSSRPYAIHEKLWNYLQGMIDRMIWGQEQFGGGFCGAGAQQGCDVNPLSRKGLRTLGTVESLMLLTEWHPRALHFPPGDDDDELMAPDEATAASYANGFLSAATNDQYRGTGGQRIDSWLEPCWRSDRMCWMLLGNAMALAYEIGVFDDKSEAEFHEENKNLPPAKVEAYFRRKNHLKELLLIYVAQTSGRVGLTSMLPRSQADKSFLKSPDDRLQERFSMLKRTGKIIREEAGSSPNAERRINSQEMVLYFWMEIAVIMERGNQEMFSNRRRTRELIKSEEYKKLLGEFQPLLRDFRNHLDRYRNTIPKLMCDILTIEYEYSRVYLNSLALQAVVERCIQNTHATATANGNNGIGSLPSGAIPPQMLMRWYGNDRYFIREVIDGCRNVLTVVVKGLEPGGYLKHAPVRTFFRIISVTIILLKTFALGATEDDVALSLSLMEEAVSALRNCIVDDVHVGNRFADMLITLITRIKSRFVRMAGSGSGKASLQVSRATSQSPSIPTAPGITSNQQNFSPHNPMMPPPHPGQSYNNTGNNQWPNYNGNNASNGLGGGASSPSVSHSNSNTNGQATPTTNPNHPLWGISTETYDPGSNNISIMPPPSFGSPYQNHLPNDPNNPNSGGNQFGGMSEAGYGYGGMGGGGADWLALPLDPLLNSYGADVNSNAYGPDVGGYDLLDVLLNGTDAMS